MNKEIDKNKKKKKKQLVKNDLNPNKINIINEEVTESENRSVIFG